MLHFSIFENLEMLHFSHFQNQMVFEHRKVGNFEEKARDLFFKQKGTENEIHRFFGFRGEMQVPSNDISFLHMPFG